MAKKKMLTGTLTVTFKVKQTDGATPESLDELETWVHEEWEGNEVYYADPNEEEETVVTLEIEKVTVATD